MTLLSADVCVGGVAGWVETAKCESPKKGQLTQTAGR